MENLYFSRRSNSFKADKLKKVICSKLPDVSEDNINKIIKSVDLNKQYFVKATRNPKKFLNTITQEDVCRDNEIVNSSTLLVYGSFQPGYFSDYFGKRQALQGNIEKCLPAAAIKTIVRSSSGEEKIRECLLVIYEPLVVSSGTNLLAHY